MLKRITYMFLTKPDFHGSSDFRPVFFLPTVKKLLTAVIFDRFYAHFDQNNILPAEEKGCCRNFRGCKDLVSIDSVAVF